MPAYDKWILVDPERRAQPRRKADITLLEQLRRTRRFAIVAFLVTAFAFFGSGYYLATLQAVEIQKANSYVPTER
jgi:hypothetical protein